MEEGVEESGRGVDGDLGKAPADAACPAERSSSS